MNNKNHNYLQDSSRNEKRTWIVMIITFVTMFAEIIAGLMSGSMALLADGWHMGTHVAAFAITIFAYSYAQKHAKTGKFSYGVGKINTLAGFTSAVALGVVALFMIAESLVRFFNPEEILYSQAITVAIIGLVVNGICALLLGHHDHGHEHSHNSDHNHSTACSHDHNHEEHSHHTYEHEANREEDHNLKAAYFHVLADAFTSVLAIIALIAAMAFGWKFLDPLMGIVGALVISKWSLGLIKDTAPMLLDEQNNEISNQIKALLEDESCTITDLHCWAVSPGKYAVSLSVSGGEVNSAHIRSVICKELNIDHIVVEVD